MTSPTIFLIGYEGSFSRSKKTTKKKKEPKSATPTPARVVEHDVRHEGD